MTKEVNIDPIYDIIDAMLRDGKFDLVDAMLSQVDMSGDVDVLLAYLTATFSAKSKLHNRASLFHRVEQVLKERDEWRETLLTGLE